MFYRRHNPSKNMSTRLFIIGTLFLIIGAITNINLIENILWFERNDRNDVLFPIILILSILMIIAGTALICASLD